MRTTRKNLNSRTLSTCRRPLSATHTYRKIAKAVYKGRCSRSPNAVPKTSSRDFLWRCRGPGSMKTLLVVLCRVLPKCRCNIRSPCLEKRRVMGRPSTRRRTVCRKCLCLLSHQDFAPRPWIWPRSPLSEIITTEFRVSMAFR